jgi:cytoskeletal protein CcmA (bactofilin family)
VASSATLKVTGSITGTTTVTGSITGSGTTGAVILNNGGMLTGTLTTSALTVNSGGILAPGNSPGTSTHSSATFSSGGIYQLQLNTDGTGTAGTAWDKVAITGNLDISGLSAGSPFVLKLQTLDSGDTPNPLSSFDSAVNHTWASIVTTGGLTGTFSSALFSIDATGFANSHSGTFSVVQNSTNLDLLYTAVPEPATYAMALGGFGMLMAIQRMRLRRS